MKSDNVSRGDKFSKLSLAICKAIKEIYPDEYAKLDEYDCELPRLIGEIEKCVISNRTDDDLREIAEHNAKILNIIRRQKDKIKELKQILDDINQLK